MVDTRVRAWINLKTPDVQTQFMNSKIKFLLVGVILVSIIGTTAFYVILPHPEVVEIVRNPDFYSDDGYARFTNVTVIVKNNGASGWVKVIAVYQVDLDKMDEKSQILYMTASESREVVFTRLTGKYIDGYFVRFPQISTARAEFAWKF